MHPQRNVQFAILKHPSAGEFSHGNDIAKGDPFLASPLFCSTTAGGHVGVIPHECSPCQKHEDDDSDGDELGVAQGQTEQVHGNS